MPAKPGYTPGYIVLVGTQKVIKQRSAGPDLPAANEAGEAAVISEVDITPLHVIWQQQLRLINENATALYYIPNGQ